MRAYIIRRLLWGIPILLGATLIVFIALHVVKGSPATSYLGKATTAADIAAFEADKGLDKSLVAQYGDYLKQVVTFDFGRSWRTDQRVGEIIRDRVGPSVSLTMPALLLTTVFAVFIGVLASYFRGRRPDRVLMTLAVLGMSVSFLVYIVVLQYLLAFRLPLFQIHGYDPGATERWQYLVLPIIILVVVGLGYDARFYRSVFVEEIGRDHVTTALAKGASTRRILFIHVLKNALIPIISRVMISVPFLITGSLLLEQFFGIPGLGAMLLASVEQSDFPVIKGLTVLITVVFILSTILNDILYAVVDPRVRLK